MEDLFFEMLVVERGAAANTIAAYRRDLQLVSEALGAPLQTATPADLRAYFQGLAWPFPHSAARRLSALKQYCLFIG